MSTDNRVVTARQPILDKDVNILGYEFFSRMNINDESSTGEHTAVTDTKTLFNFFSSFDLDTLLNGKKVFLNCVLEESEIMDYFDLLSPKNLVLEVALPTNLEDQAIIDDIADKMQQLKANGYTLACSEIVFHEKYSKWFDAIKYIKFAECAKINASNLKTIVTNMRKAKDAGKLLVAEKVETRAQFDVLKKLDFDYYQGYFFSKPVNVSVKLNNPSMVTLLKLINLVIAEASFKEIEVVLKTDATISFKLLRYLNSVGVGGGEKVETFQRALNILGYRKLLKWLSILFTSVDKKQGQDVISKTALTRARFMESMAAICEPRDSDAYFMVGLFSMLDALLGVDLNVAINSINISEEVRDAVLGKETRYTPLLHIAKNLEQGDWIEILSTLYKLKLATDIMNQKYMESIQWVEELKI
jgi:EAL and modified HD-GYP domain-containing signal transduction protein